MKKAEIEKLRGMIKDQIGDYYLSEKKLSIKKNLNLFNKDTAVTPTELKTNEDVKNIHMVTNLNYMT